MNPNQLRQTYINFFLQQNHQEIPSAPLVPQNDPTTLFTSSGMQPLVPYLLGEIHPQGDRLVNSQKSFRSQDIEEVGDNRHTTFFEMLGNWSLGDYFKKEQLSWFFEFLTNSERGLGLDPNKLYVTVFSGDPDAKLNQDDESITIWQQLFKTQSIEAKYVKVETEEQGYKQGMQQGRIFGYGVKKNWWSRSGVPSAMPPGEPGGPDSEVFYDFGTKHNPSYGEYCHPNCDCGRFLEIGNSVFMQFKKEADGQLTELPHKNVDFGGGFERLLAAAFDQSDIFNTELFSPLIKVIEHYSQKKYSDLNYQPSIRVITDHLRAAVFLVSDGVEPSNKAQGYFLRRLIRRSVVKLNQLEISDSKAFTKEFVSTIFSIYQGVYFSQTNSKELAQVITDEIHKFSATLSKGIKIFEKTPVITGKIAFDLLQTYGFPWELTLEMALERKQSVDKTEFETEFKKHQQLSRTSSKGMFKGGLVDHSESTTKLHTATHLLHAALRKHLGNHVRQEGSHITPERLRFDFIHSEKLSDQEIKTVETEINQIIQDNLPVNKTIEDKDSAIKSGAIAFFREKYPDKVSVYTIGSPDKPYSKEFCGGPHVSSTGEIGAVTINKQESIGSGKRRIYASLKQ